MQNAESNLTKRSASAPTDCKETPKTSVSRLAAELTLIAHLMKNVTVFNHFHKPENVQDFVWETHAPLALHAQLRIIEKFVLVIHLWLEMVTRNVENRQL